VRGAARKIAPGWPFTSRKASKNRPATSRRTRAERSTSIETRLTTAARNALADAGSAGEAW